MFHNILKASALLPMLFSTAAMAGIPPTPGNVPQLPCEVSRVSSLHELGQVAIGRTFVTKDRKSSVGNAIGAGDLVYYVSLVDGVKYYTTPKQIEILDGSPLTPDVALVPAGKYESFGTFRDKNGRRFDLVAVGGFTVMVDDTGMICSTRLNDRLVSVAMPTVYQEVPVTATMGEAAAANPRRVSIAVTVREIDAASFSLDVSVLVNGQAQQRRTSTFDLFSGQAKIGDLEVAVSRGPAGGLKIDSLVEPADYDIWLKQIFRR
ncbi:hypothetical protein RY831_14910 [Noviherbaspirillum sp. CPCC 100848]|uniref:Uncharacterized protein n=1 Tax=Noviherbaspirillum album TaxID=3080276 RepID=A0ABU6J9W9_9BURK|nr:hypothetical protein [Noviherbaspirillum sp. CPCC 100848]MEC4720451.1 hypothetical protein [Noviherbaspirillum sp. CPCC 100848]